MQPSIGENVIGPATPARPHSPSNRHHQLDLPPTKQIIDDSTFNVLQLNANGIGNKLTELEVVLERNKIKVAVIQESTLSPKSKKFIKHPELHHSAYGQGGGLLIFIHRSITFSKHRHQSLYPIPTWKNFQ